ncbi:MAG TPA: GNAT family N-acetyltransferase [Anaerolineales bacterium]|nr:GNAT family N-acetyltransferase [Anaerolineales bacterium]
MMLIRNVRADEYKLLSELAISAKRHWGYPEQWMEIWAPQLTFTPEYFEAHEGWAAVDGEKPVAFYTLEDKNGIAWLENLWVSPEYIGRGVGKELFHHAVTLARQRGYKSLQLEADPNATGFYERMGMMKIGGRHSEVDGLPRILPIMEMAL